MKRQFSAGIVSYHKENDMLCYLLLYYFGGYWDFPKGKIEEGENKLQTALRELKEETGLDAQIVRGFEDHVEYFFRAEGELFFKTVFFFLGKVQITKISLSHEHLDYGWFGYEQAYEQLTYQNSKDVLERANQFLAEFV
ncbi:NUDIX domain-containing protein [Candidatus Dependentiae bacterium]|nr:MAG: NUDIX domain-containing protein [Candidatus Dependentiae bacterium]